MVEYIDIILFMDIDQKIHSLVRDSVFIDLDLKTEIINYISGVDEAEKREVLKMLQNLESKKDFALKKVLTSDEQKYKDFIFMTKTLKGEKLATEEKESETKDKSELKVLENEINSLD
ncbi:hypothetical protein JW758_03585 [Candidatus Peregrinibacteria bacterium]|nr:hypothetical protein [Candidatus Peregrinibacteria bacterium]